MAKRSQLSQLKQALSQAGITRQSQSGKKRKRTSTQGGDEDSNNNNNTKAAKAVKLDEIRQKLNPFDGKVTKLKHDVSGGKGKGVTGRPAQSTQSTTDRV